jgi:hypothetical protein
MPGLLPICGGVPRSDGIHQLDCEGCSPVRDLQSCSAGGMEDAVYHRDRGEIIFASAGVTSFTMVLDFPVQDTITASQLDRGVLTRQGQLPGAALPLPQATR